MLGNQGFGEAPKADVGGVALSLPSLEQRPCDPQDTQTREEDTGLLCFPSARSGSIPHFTKRTIWALFLIPVQMWLLWVPSLRLFSIIELFTLLWESSVPLAWASGGCLQLFCEMPFFFFFHWLLSVKFCLLQTFVETGRALSRRV